MVPCDDLEVGDRRGTDRRFRREGYTNTYR